jgi:Helix-turn-helix domain
LRKNNTQVAPKLGIRIFYSKTSAGSIKPHHLPLKIIFTQVGFTLGKKKCNSYQFCHKQINYTDMAAMIITTDDLAQFKNELLDEFKKLVQDTKTTPQRKWLKSHEVRRLLTISPGTLQNLRVNGTLPFTKIGGVIYYEYEDIKKMLEQHKRKSAQKTMF